MAQSAGFRPIDTVYITFMTLRLCVLFAIKSTSVFVGVTQLVRHVLALKGAKSATLDKSRRPDTTD